MAEHSEPPSTQGHEETPPPTGTAQDTDRASQKQPGVTAEDADSDPDFDDLDGMYQQPTYPPLSRTHGNQKKKKDERKPRD